MAFEVSCDEQDANADCWKCVENEIDALINAYQSISDENSDMVFQETYKTLERIRRIKNNNPENDFDGTLFVGRE